MNRATGVLLLAVIACGSNRAARSPSMEPAAPVAGPPPVSAAAVVSAAEDKPPSLVDHLLGDLRDIADELCACHDSVCLDKATEKLVALSKKYADISDLGDVPAEATDEADAIAERMADCAARITIGRKKRPKLPGEP